MLLTSRTSTALFESCTAAMHSLVAPEKPSQTPNAMFAGHMMLEHVEGRARTTCNQARKKAI
ncbi:hypothetical protein, partial [Xanthomonas oryzae]|uniref:hypothetical protein n=1 Tax=Xanthomonas oryzae TaxID=347 RepID=UPI003CF328D0